MKNSKSKILFAVAAVVMATLAVTNTQAATCTLDNWAAKEGATKLSVGTRADGNRRVAGPCGLRVALDGIPAYLTDTSPVAETTFNVRFYFFLNGVTSNVTLFQAEDGSSVPVITATYDASANDVSVVFANAGAAQTLVAQDVGTGWNSLEIQWTASGTAQPKVILGSATAVQGSGTIDTSNLVIEAAKLGAIGTVPTITEGSIDFDDYDSRRDTVPGRLCRGLTDPSRSILTFEDAREIFKDAVSITYNANGQPDFDLNGAVTFQDARDVFARAVSSTNRDCSKNQ